jgi:hypothetical protein
MTAANLKDVTPERARVRPAPDANDAHWVLAHIVFWRGRILEMLGEEGTGTEVECRQRTFPELVYGLEALQSRVLAALDGDVADEVRADIGFLTLHEAYHVGQLGLLRRSMGLPGVIGS